MCRASLSIRSQSQGLLSLANRIIYGPRLAVSHLAQNAGMEDPSGSDAHGKRRRRKRRRNPGDIVRSIGFRIALWCAIIVAVIVFTGLAMDLTTAGRDRLCAGSGGDGPVKAGCQ
jgi:hypothetical protein